MIWDQLKDYIYHLRLFSPNARRFLVGSFFMGFGFSVFWLLLNLYLKQVGFEEGRIGSIISASSVGTVLMAVPAAILIDRFRIKHILMIAAVVDGTALITQAMSTTIWSLRAMSVLSGAMMTVHFIAASPFFMRNSTPAERPYLFGVNMALSTLSGFVGSIIGGFVPTWLAESGVALLYGYRYTLIAGASLAMMAFFAYATIKSKKPPNSEIFSLRRYLGARDWRTVSKLMIPHFIIGMGAGLVIPFLNLYFLQRFELESDTIGQIFSAGSLFTAAGFLVGPALAKKIGLIKTVVVTQFLSIPFFLILAFSHNLNLSVIAFLFRGSLMNMAWPMYINFAMEVVPEKDQAGTNSVLSLAWNSSWMVSANLGGIMIERSGFTVVMLTTVAFYLTSTSSVWILFRHRQRIGMGKPAELTGALERPGRYR
jgi:MFS family permease